MLVTSKVATVEESNEASADNEVDKGDEAGLAINYVLKMFLYLTFYCIFGKIHRVRNKCQELLNREAAEDIFVSRKSRGCK